MQEPPAHNPTQAEHRRALRQQARGGDPGAQAQVDALNARTRAYVAKAQAEGRGFWTPEALAARRAKKIAAPAPLTAAAAQQAAQQRAQKRASCKAYYQAWRQRLAAGDPDVVAKHAQRLAQSRQRRASKTGKLAPEQRSKIARQGALKRWGKRAGLTE